MTVSTDLTGVIQPANQPPADPTSQTTNVINPATSTTTTTGAPEDTGALPTSPNPQAVGAQSPTGSETSGQNAFIQNLEQQQAVSPALQPGTQVVAQAAQDTPDTNLNSPGSQVAGNVNATATSAGPSAQVDPNAFNTAVAQYNPNTIGGNAAQGTASQAAAAPQVTAAQGQIAPEDTVAGQFNNLTQGVANGAVPDFAKNAVAAANQQMASRGLGASTIAGGAMASAIFGAALPIAQADAGANLTMAMANLNNQQQAVLANANSTLQTNLANLSADQQTNLQNLQNKQASLLSDQAAENAASQFNASSTNQMQQFMASLASTIAQQNASRSDAMSQFNAGQANSISQFNSNLDNQRQQFNATNQLAIDQSNVQWRRTLNTTNTAAVNAANQVNAQNLFNLSSTAQNNLWQQWRDEATWANTDSENAATRSTNLAIAALGASTAFGLNNQIAQNQMAQQLGAFGINLFNNFVSSQSATGSA